MDHQRWIYKLQNRVGTIRIDACGDDETVLEAGKSDSDVGFSDFSRDRFVQYVLKGVAPSEVRDLKKKKKYRNYKGGRRGKGSF